jgi:Ribosomal protein L23
MEARDIILRPVITEASTALFDDKRYTFDVDVRATKTQLKKLLKKSLTLRLLKLTS